MLFTIILKTELKYDPGDHVGVMTCNRKEIVDAIMKRLKDVEDYEKPVQLQVMKETLTPTGKKNGICTYLVNIHVNNIFIENSAEATTER